MLAVSVGVVLFVGVLSIDGIKNYFK